MEGVRACMNWKKKRRLLRASKFCCECCQLQSWPFLDPILVFLGSNLGHVEYIERTIVHDLFSDDQGYLSAGSNHGTTMVKIGAMASPQPWRTSKAKALLVEDLEKGIVTSEMRAATVYQMRAEYKPYAFSRFSTNFRNLLAARSKPKKMKPLNWKTSKAKQLLLSDLENGITIDTMSAEHIYDMNDEYKKFPFHNFSSNLETYREKLRNQQKVSDDDLAAYIHDMQLGRRPSTTVAGYPLWGGSEAARLLKLDIDSLGPDGIVVPRQLHSSRLEYLAFPLITKWPPWLPSVIYNVSRLYWKHYRQNKKNKNGIV